MHFISVAKRFNAFQDVLEFFREVIDGYTSFQDSSMGILEVIKEAFQCFSGRYNNFWGASRDHRSGI